MAADSATTSSQERASSSSQSTATERLQDNSDQQLWLKGLMNLGNTCYMNSVLQALFATVKFREYIISHARSKSHTSNSQDAGAESSNPNAKLMTRALARLFKKMASPPADERYSLSAGPITGTYINPTQFSETLTDRMPQFATYEQQDAQEFLIQLRDELHKEVNQAKTRRKADSQQESADNAKTAEEAWERYRQYYDDSPLVDMFVGQFGMITKCVRCGHRSTSWEPFWDIDIELPQTTAKFRHLIPSFLKPSSMNSDSSASSSASSSPPESPNHSPYDQTQAGYPSADTGGELGGSASCTGGPFITNSPTVSLVSCLEHFFEYERLTDDNCVECPNCQMNTRCLRKVTIERLPSVLIITLKKFTNDFKKILSPQVTIDSAFVLDDHRYQLYAAVSHHGSRIYRGHYTAVAQHRAKWYTFNDTIVRDINAFSPTKLYDAYICFYEQVGKVPL